MPVYGGAKHNLYSSSTFIKPLYSPISEDDSYLVGCPQQSRLKDCQGCTVIDGEIRLYSPIIEDDSYLVGCPQQSRRKDCQGCTVIDGEIRLYSPIIEDDSYLVGCLQQSRLKDCQGCTVIDGEIRPLRHQCRSMEEPAAPII